MTDQTAIEVPSNMVAKLEALAERTGVAADDHLVAAIDAHISQEDQSSGADQLDDIQPPAFEEMVTERMRCGESQLFEAEPATLET